MQPAVSDAQANSRDRYILRVSAQGSPEKVDVSIPAESLRALAAKTSASFTIETPIAAITVMKPADLSKDAKTITASFQKTAGGAVAFSLKEDGRDSAVPFRAELPVPAGLVGSYSLVMVDAGAAARASGKLLPKSAWDPDLGRVTLPGASSGATLGVIGNPKSFTDVQGHWAQKEGVVDFTSSHELIVGTAKGRFSPSMTVDRAMIVAILHRLESSPETAQTGGLNDIEPDAWYAEAAYWGQSTGIVMGKDGGRFDPKGSATREQIASFLYRYAQQCGMDTAGRADMGRYTDAGKIDSWAKDAMSWCVDKGVICGNEYGDLSPRGKATRAEAAAMITRFIRTMNGRRN